MEAFSDRGGTLWTSAADCWGYSIDDYTTHCCWNIILIGNIVRCLPRPWDYSSRFRFQVFSKSSACSRYRTPPSRSLKEKPAASLCRGTRPCSNAVDFICTVCCHTRRRPQFLSENSSRFSLHTKVFFSSDVSRVLGAEYNALLLQTSRLSGGCQGDSTFHIFDQV